MSKKKKSVSDLLPLMKNYCKIVEDGLHERWSKWNIEIHDAETYEVIGGLLSRQASLTTYLAMAPQIWNGHIAPLILRSMTDAHITLSWILQNPKERAQKYILYGLGQEKLYIEHLKNETDPDEPAYQEMIKMREGWLNSQRLDFLTIVNTGNWSELTTRKMSEESGTDSLYKYSYTPFSGVVHNMWQHISRYNLKYCDNPLHKYHLVPEIREVGIDPDYVYRSVKYIDRSYEIFDEKYKLKIETPSPHDWYVKEYKKYCDKE
jgi:hypothetical protein